MNDFTFGNETKNCVLTRHHESANILCAEPVRRSLDAGSGAIVVTSVPFRLRMLSMVIASSIVWPSRLSHLAPAIGGRAMESVLLYEEH